MPEDFLRHVFGRDGKTEFRGRCRIRHSFSKFLMDLAITLGLQHSEERTRGGIRRLICCLPMEPGCVEACVLLRMSCPVPSNWIFLSDKLGLVVVFLALWQ